MTINATVNVKDGGRRNVSMSSEAMIAGEPAMRASRGRTPHSANATNPPVRMNIERVSRSTKRRVSVDVVRDEVAVHLGENPPIPAGELVELIGFFLFDPPD